MKNGTVSPPGRLPLQDRLEQRAVTQRETIHSGMIWDVVREQYRLNETPESPQITREFIEHPGAVAILAYDDGDPGVAARVLLLSQYRHPVRSTLWEIPAGLLDIAGEPPHLAAARELAEEADLYADDWAVLLDTYNSAGGSSEAVRIYLARGLHEVPAEKRHIRTEEESEIQLQWLPLSEAVTAVFAGKIHSFSAVAAILAAATAAPDFRDLRPADAPWPEHASDPQHPAQHI